ncbi:MAG: response regulator [Pyrinomonadaceae bacterium]|nr:response regulator [Pyrinomonadaceae bacterium]
MRELSELYDFRVLEAENGEEAIELTLQKRPDLILLDTELLKIDGYEVAQVISNIESLEKMTIIFLCAETNRVFRKRAFEVGGGSFYIAPLDLERLDLILGHFLF